LFDFPLYFAVREVFAKGQPMARLDAVLAADTNYVNARTLVTFLGLHDTPRFMSEAGATVDGLQLAFTYLFTARGTPMIYYGDEIGMHGGGDPHNRADFPGGWSDDPRNAFTAAGRTGDEERMHHHVRKLIALRRELEPLRRGATLPLQSRGQTCALARVTGDSGVIVTLNNSDQPQSMQVTVPSPLASQSRWFNRLANDAVVTSSNGVLALELPPRQAAILSPEPPAIAVERGETKTSSLTR